MWNIITAILILAIICVVCFRAQKSGADVAPRFDGKFHVMQFTIDQKCMMYLGTIVFLGLALLAAYFPGRTNPSDIPWIITLCVAFGCWIAYLSLLTQILKVRWNDSEIWGRDAFGRRQSFQWDDLASIENTVLLQGFKLRSKGGAYVMVSAVMLGFGSFKNKLDAECA
jgi:hypothetical protein